MVGHTDIIQLLTKYFINNTSMIIGITSFVIVLCVFISVKMVAQPKMGKPSKQALAKSRYKKGK
ncbi:hypothetical protein QJ527_10840 [Enterococcus mundtii]|uniref:hypothetical protein n=1 Tax=Enterococcus TaxID=1350 RepID=UPI0004496507|nr:MULTISPECIES: hypothetical protein [Enterococcus]AZP92824.1 hypothetical protein CYK55_06780 [Enterococcus mundtii]EYT96213.1 hypothetical protein AK89_04755 [Enterococcus mundtii CRL35]MDA9428951.1 hypothetical protein [Enterococcus mundtii 1A]MDK4212028.1 hypothetical protein [Enterococcus mundtii]MDO7879664.1 hypothetical protein [Enterococcus mundtii]